MKSNQAKFLLAGARNRGKKFTPPPPPPPPSSRFFSFAHRFKRATSALKPRKRVENFSLFSSPPLLPLPRSPSPPLPLPVDLEIFSPRAIRPLSFTGEISFGPSRSPSSPSLPPSSTKRRKKTGWKGRWACGGRKGGKSSFFFVGTFL